jgi:glycosyltransferase involved in cell wall biosynthesis
MISDSFTSLLPRLVVTTFGTPEFVDWAKHDGRLVVRCLPPPIDLAQNRMAAVSGSEFRKQQGLGDEDVLLVTVSRLHQQLKGESLVRSVNAVSRLAEAFPVRFCIVGDGDLRPKLEALASDVNHRLQRTVVQVVGPMLDPRPAYAAADIVIGMGGSALRAMAFSKALVIVGADGFAAT